MNDQEQANLVTVPSSLFAAIHDAFGVDDEDGGAAERLRDVGVRIGSELAGTLSERLDASPAGGLSGAPSDRFWSELRSLLREMGWGSFEQERLHPGIISLASDDWFEARGHGSQQPCCHLTVGVLGELFRSVSAHEVSVLEVRCRGAGAERCRFLIGSVDAMNAVYERVRGGGHYREAVAALG